jgi:hypothetical protein
MSVCILDDAGLCRGCRRTIHEIASWGRLSASQQWEVIARIEQRREADRAAPTTK